MKLLRRSHPAESNVLLLSYIFFTACFFSYQMFGVKFHEFPNWNYAFIGMILTGMSATIMVMIVWEEMLFPVNTHKVEGGLLFRNHRSKLNTQILLYCSIPAIFCFIYFQFNVNLVHFIIWALICMVPPAVEKIVSGVKNYNDYLKMTEKEIEYKNNEKAGLFYTKDLKAVSIIEDESKVTKKVQLIFLNNDSVIIDLHEMELDVFYDSIDKFVTSNYNHLLKSYNDLKIAG